MIMGKDNPNGMAYIPGGDFTMGSDRGYNEELPLHKVTLFPYYIDKYLVTNAQFKEYCDAVGRGYPADPRWASMPGYFLNYPDYPVVNVSWGEANAYAEWTGKRLPTEEEWEFAAAGGLPAPRYPWGDAFTGANCNYADSSSDYQWRDFSVSDGYAFTSPVGHYEANGYGLFDMAGNVWEWTEDWFFAYNDEARDVERFKDGWGGSKVCRGGSYHNPPGDLRIARRRQILGGNGNIAVGFRCVKDAEGREHKKKVEFELKSEPAEWKSMLKNRQAALEPAKELCCGIGGADANLLSQLRNLGFTSAEQYVTWETCENRGEGDWDFSYWDKQLELVRASGLKWLPFVIAGPAYALPDWYRAGKDHLGARCLEHNMESLIQSHFDKGFYKYIERFIKKFAEHYSDHSVFEGVLFGVTGDFGESIVSDWHGNWPTQIPGLYHAHSGYWCNDPYARADFKDKMREKFKTIEQVNQAWGTEFPSFENLSFPPVESDPKNFRIDEHTTAGVYRPETAGQRRRWVDFVDWYRGSMTEYVRFWMETARKYLPDTELYICTGGDAVAWHAAEFAAQCKVCAEVGGGVRITNEASNYGVNFTVTNWVASAGAFYNAYYSFEPAGQVTERGAVCRIYNAAATNAKGLHYYSGNILDSEQKCKNFITNIGMYKDVPIHRHIAYLYPDTPTVLNPARRVENQALCSLLRDYTDYCFACDLTISDGILKRENGIKALIIAVDGCYRSATLEAVKEFVSEGGLLAGVNIRELKGLEDDKDWLPVLFGGGGLDLGAGHTMLVNAGYAPGGTTEQTALQQNLFDPITEFLSKYGVPVYDGKIDNIFTAVKGGGLIVLNYNGSPEPYEREFLLPGGEPRRAAAVDSMIYELN
ncbi:MAG: formylglycine-generating enzyme family protein [Oscillospiraceae bacterium]|nr:formylglycine-generating enzyme family protein [Oscillospiraceae bacterium]